MANGVDAKIDQVASSPVDFELHLSW